MRGCDGAGVDRREATRASAGTHAGLALPAPACRHRFAFATAGAKGREVLRSSPAELAQLVRAYLTFRKGWADVAQKHPRRVKLISYEQLADYGRDATLRAALRFLSLPVRRAYRSERARWRKQRLGGPCEARLRNLTEHEALVAIDRAAWHEYDQRNDQLRADSATARTQVHCANVPASLRDVLGCSSPNPPPPPPPQPRPPPPPRPPSLQRRRRRRRRPTRANATAHLW